MKTRQTEVVYAAVIILICFWAEYWTAHSDISFGFAYGIIIICLLLKISYIVSQSFKSIVGIVRKGTAYHIYLIYIAANAILIITSFGSDYFALHIIQPEAFEGMAGVGNEFEVFFKMFYLSLLLFTNLGVADIVPATTQAEVLVMSEGIIAFVSLIFMLSDYTTLRESFGQKQALDEPNAAPGNDKSSA